ncbi:MAG: glucokinase [Desulfobacterales bacterium]|nr:glucokinase [Desulfobacterales bacterium]
MKSMEDKTVILAGDIGGTKTMLGLFAQGKKRPLLRQVEAYSSREAPNLQNIIQRFIDAYPISIDRACLGIAGPVKNGRCKATNLPWEVTEKEIKKRFGWNQVRLINDLSATALAIPFLNQKEIFSLTKTKSIALQPRGLVAPGTGLGQALLIFCAGRYIPISSEGGHADFAPANEKEMSLWRYLQQRYTHVSIERVLSGPGLVNIYSWLKNTHRYQEPGWLSQNLKMTDSAMAVAKAAMDFQHPVCLEALNMFVSIFGAVAGNLALTGMTTGGIYLGGGISPKILPKLKEEIFLKAFTNKGRFKEHLQQIPIRIILNEKAALLGAAIFAFQLNKENRYSHELENFA